MTGFLKKLLFNIPLLLFAQSCVAQEMWGIANSNYAGIMGLELNPASFMSYPYKREFHLVSADIMLQNDYLYLPAGKSPLISLITFKPISQDDIRDQFTSPSKNAYGNLFLKFPSYAWRNDVYSWNVHLSLRQQISARDVAYHFAKFLWEGSDYVPLHEIDFKAGPFKATATSVGEIGVTHSRVMYNYETNFVTGGATVNLLDGMTGIYIHNKNLDYTIVSDSVLNIRSLSADYGHALPNKGEYSLMNIIQPKGIGATFSVGMQWMRNRDPLAYKGGVLSKKPFKKYTWKAGASLIDIGFIKYKNLSETFSFESDSNYWPGFDTTKFYGVAYTDSLLSQRLIGNPLASKDGEKFTIYTPAAISLQFDYSITPYLYANATIIHPLYAITPAVRRPAQTAITLRYERRHWEIAVPVSVYEYDAVRVGIGARIGVLVIGSDNALALTGLTNSYGFDLFFGIKWPLEDKGSSKKAKSGKDCPTYK